MSSGLLTAFPFAALFLSGDLSARQTAGAAFSSAADALPSAAEAVWAAFVLRRGAFSDSLLKTLCHCERRSLALAGGCYRSIHRAAEKRRSRKPRDIKKPGVSKASPALCRAAMP